LATLARLLLLLLLAALLSATLLLTALLTTLLATLLLLLLLLILVLVVLIHCRLQIWKRPNGRLRTERDGGTLRSLPELDATTSRTQTFISARKAA
jgi:hypothetical protein